MTVDYDAVVYDLDGTLVHLDVDWDRTREAVAGKLRARDVDVDGKSLWTLFETADTEPLEQVVEETISEYEREGARRSDSLALADELPHDVPVAVCSLNCEAACRIALEIHGLDGDVDAIVGRDTVTTQKPDPEPLLHAIQSLDAEPAETLFIGDSERDELTADRAGVDFEYVTDR